MAEVQFSDIIQVAAIGLTLATLKLGLEQFLTKSLLAERQDFPYLDLRILRALRLLRILK
jgi:hypothetical protein